MSPDENFVAELLSWETVVTPAGRASVFVCLCVCVCTSSTDAHPAAGGRCSRLWQEAKDSGECCDETVSAAATGGEREEAALLFLFFSEPRGLEKKFLLIVLNISLSGYIDVKRASRGKK